MIEIHPFTEVDPKDALRVLSTAFGGRAKESLIEAEVATVEPERFFAAVEEERIVATAGTYSLQLTVPGGASVPIGGLTWVGVLPTHRRRGLMRRMMMRHLEDVAARGEPLGALLASEAAIYGRFGYGIATMLARYEMDRRGSTFLSPTEDPGSVRLVDKETFLGLVTDLHERIRLRTVGEVSRPTVGWNSVVASWEEEASGWQGMLYGVHDDADGEPDGFVVYRVGEDSWEHALPQMRLDIFKVVGVNDAVRNALVRYLLDIDLVKTVRILDAPVDDPVRWLLADPRQLRTIRVWDGLWLRVVDVPAALTARRYENAGQLTIEVVDDVLPAVAGRYLLDGSPADASCVSTQKDPDIVLGVRALASLYLGGVSATALAAAGRIEERTAGAVSVADRMFTTARAPFCETGF